MSAHKKMVAQMREGALLERNRCMKICATIIADLKTDLDHKLMTATQKHLADVKLSLAQGLLGAVQIKIASGEEPDAKAEASQIHGQDADALGGTREDPDGGRAG